MILLVVDNPENWTLDVPKVDVVSARAYLSDPRHAELRRATVFNLCRSYAYQRLGYYVSLLAAARGHRAKPSIETIMDMRSQVVTRLTSHELGDLTRKALSQVRADEFVLSIYFGRPLVKRHEKLAQALFQQFQVPLLRARFTRSPDGWDLAHVGPIPSSEIPPGHREFVAEAARDYFASGRFTPRRSRPVRCRIAILHDPEEPAAPSNMPALRKFVQAAHHHGAHAELITRQDFAWLAEHDALFIRATTAVDHYTYRFARRGEAEGLVVIDSPSSILRCSNKVYLAEMLQRYDVPAPATVVVHRHNRDSVVQSLALPCVLKQPDSAFSAGVSKVTTREELDAALDALLDDSELVIAQEYLLTDYDWRIGILDRKVLFACRYHMAKDHWQIIDRDAAGRMRYGNVDSLPLDVVPPPVLKAALRAASQIGDGLYGVDLKTVGKRALVIEVNDNPNIDAGIEDHCLGAELYRRIIGNLIERVERQRRGES